MSALEEALLNRDAAVRELRAHLDRAERAVETGNHRRLVTSLENAVAARTDALEKQVAYLHRARKTMEDESERGIVDFLYRDAMERFEDANDRLREQESARLADAALAAFRAKGQIISTTLTTLADSLESGIPAGVEALRAELRDTKAQLSNSLARAEEARSECCEPRDVERISAAVTDRQAELQALLRRCEVALAAGGGEPATLAARPAPPVVMEPAVDKP